jgi:signal transduction histidine kinase
VEIEDHGDDLRIAVLDVRHYHRNLTFAGPSRGGIQVFENAYARLQQEIDELEELGIQEPDAPQPDELRRAAEEYSTTFRPAVALYDSDREAFDTASDQGLEMLEGLEDQAREIDQLGEKLSTESLERVDQANANARLVLLAVLGGLVLAGGGLAYAVVRVVSELRRLYAREREATTELARASQAKTDFIADASHELRTPLTVLRVNAEVGLQMDRDCAHDEILEEILQESDRMRRMVEDLLFLARSDSDSLPLELETVAVAPFLAELASRAQVLARERGASFETELNGEGMARVDPARIEQAVLVLVDNAAKYGLDGGLVTLASESGLDELRVTVLDRGPGILEKDLGQIFERFYRADKSRSRKQGGTGLGLPIARTIAEAHGGRIEAESRPGEGTRMTLRLPLASSPQPASKPLALEDKL